MSQIGTNRTYRAGLSMSVDRGGNGKHMLGAGISHFDPFQTIASSIPSG